MGKMRDMPPVLGSGRNGQPKRLANEDPMTSVGVTALLKTGFREDLREGTSSRRLFQEQRGGFA